MVQKKWYPDDAFCKSSSVLAELDDKNNVPIDQKRKENRKDRHERGLERSTF